MEKFFIVTEKSALHQEYMKYKEFENKMWTLCKRFMNEQGVETTQYYRDHDSFAIVPTENDKKKFATMLKKSSIGHGLYPFKKNSKVGKSWLKFIEDNNIKFKYKPFVSLYFKNIGGKHRNRLFSIDDKVYCSFENDNYDVDTPDGFIEIKASEFWKIVEECQAKEKSA